MPNITTNHAITYTNQMVVSEIIPLFHEYTIWLSIDLMGNELR